MPRRKSLLLPLTFGLPVDVGINGIINDVLKTSAAEAAAVPRGMRLLGGSPEQMVAYMAQERAPRAPIIKAADITAE
jgi:hypothetical protein